MPSVCSQTENTTLLKHSHSSTFNKTVNANKNTNTISKANSDQNIIVSEANKSIITTKLNTATNQQYLANEQKSASTVSTTILNKRLSDSGLFNSMSSNNSSSSSSSFTNSSNSNGNITNAPTRVTVLNPSVKTIAKSFETNVNNIVTSSPTKYSSNGGLSIRQQPSKKNSIIRIINSNNENNFNLNYNKYLLNSNNSNSNKQPVVKTLSSNTSNAHIYENDESLTKNSKEKAADQDWVRSGLFFYFSLFKMNFK